MTKKAAILAILLISISLAFSTEAQKPNYWIDVNVGGNELYEKSFDPAFMSGLSYQVKGPYFISGHISFPVWTNDFVTAYDLQYGRTIGSGPIRLCPAVGIGYAKVGNYSGYDELQIKGAVTLPVSCNLQGAFTRHSVSRRPVHIILIPSAVSMVCMVV